MMKNFEKINHKEREWFIPLEIHGHGGPPVLLDTCLTFPFSPIFIPDFSTLSFLHFYNVAHSKFLIYCHYSSLYHILKGFSGFREFLEVSRDTFLMRFLEKMT